MQISVTTFITLLTIRTNPTYCISLCFCTITIGNNCFAPEILA
jgi:hypothetical protein